MFMKFFNFLIFFFCFQLLHAQNEVSDIPRESFVNKGLSEEEFILAKKMYLEMTKSETYVLSKKYTREFSAKVGKANLPPVAEISKWGKDRTLLKVWLSDNLKETTFSSVEDGLLLYENGLLQQKKLFEENRELYNKMIRASSDQRREIIKPEIKFLLHQD